MKIDQSGVFKWAKYYGDSTGISRFESSVASVDGGLTFVGETFSFGSANRRGVGYLVHTDKDGNIGGSANCKVRSMGFATFSFRTTDSTNIVVVEGGDELASNLRRENITVVKSDICSATGLKTDVAACLRIGVSDNYRLPENAVKIYPNPVKTQLFVEIDANTEGSNQVSNVQIFDALGRLIQAQKTVNYRLSLDVSAFASGIYVVKLEKGGKYLTKKFIVE